MGVFEDWVDRSVKNVESFEVALAATAVKDPGEALGVRAALAGLVLDSPLQLLLLPEQLILLPTLVSHALLQLL